MNALELREVTKNYASKRALDNASFSIPAGTVFGLLGPNGAGKTTLIRIITHITAADSGSVHFGGELLSAKHTDIIGYLPEERGLYRKMPVMEQGIYFARLKGISKKEAVSRLEDWFERFDISDWKNKKVEELSKGMQQKAQFIFTVLHEPSLVILDEPFTGFDPVNAELVKNEILRMRNEGKTIVLSTHRMESVEELCDEIAFINHGKIVLKDNINAIKESYKEHKIEVETSTPVLNIPGDFTIEKSIQQRNGRYLHELKIPSGLALNEALRKLSSPNEIYSFREVLPGMSEIFVKLANLENA